MLDRVPDLKAKPPGPMLRVAGRFLSGVGEVTAQISPYTEWWNRQNQQAVGSLGPLLTVIGDSTAVGIGATHPGLGYVGRLAAAFQQHNIGDRGEATAWRVINLAQSGAKIADGLERQLPLVDQLPPADVVVCCLGSNDVVWGVQTNSMRRAARDMVAELRAAAAPSAQVVVCPVAGASGRARLVNRAIRAAAENHGIDVASPWGEPGPGPSERLAADRFHPNDLGYQLMTRALARHFGIELDFGPDELGPIWHQVDDPSEFTQA